MYLWAASGLIFELSNLGYECSINWGWIFSFVIFPRHGLDAELNFDIGAARGSDLLSQ